MRAKIYIEIKNKNDKFTHTKHDRLQIAKARCLIGPIFGRPESSTFALFFKYLVNTIILLCNQFRCYFFFISHNIIISP